MTGDPHPAGNDRPGPSPPIDPRPLAPAPTVIESHAFEFLYNAPYWFALFTAAAILTLILSALGYRIWPRAGVEPVCIGVVVSAALAMIFVTRMKSRQQRRLAAVRELPAHAQAARILPTLGGWMSMTRLNQFVRQLADTGHSNLIVLLTPHSKRPPIDVAFEPISWETAGAAAVASEAGTALPDVAAGGSLMGRLRRSFSRRRGGWWIAPVGLFGLTAVAWTTPLRPLLLGLLVLNVLATLAGLFLPAVTPFRGVDWFLVPGGLVRRVNRALGGCDIRLFRRIDCVAAACRTGGREWCLIMADSTDLVCVAGTREEVDFALRALASPLPPPSKDMIRSALS